MGITWGVSSWNSSELTAFIMTKLVLLLGLAMVPSIHSLCAIQGCDKWWNAGAKSNVSITGACAVMFDENCCKASKTFYIVKREEEGKLCGTVSSFNPFSSCEGPRLKDDIESLVVMPGCTLEVWDKGSGLADAKKEEAKSYNKGNYKDNEDRYDRNKLVFSAFKDIQIVEEINDDFDDMDEDIESYRCRCNQGSKPSGTKPFGTKPSGPKPSGTKPFGTKPIGTKPSGTKPSGTKPSGTKRSGK